MSPGPSDSVNRVSGEIEGLRGELSSLVGELDRRRHDLLDLRLQARRHPAVVIGVAAGVVLLASGLVALSLRSRRQRRRPSSRARDARRALARLLAHPDRVAAEPSVGNKVLAAVGTAAGSVLARRAVELLWARSHAAAAARDGAMAQQQ